MDGGASGRWKAILGNKADVIALGDIGADYSCMPESLACLLEKEGVATRTALENEMFLSGAVLGDKIRATSVLRTTLTLQLNCAPLVLRNVEFLVLAHEMDEVLLGRPLLALLGFDLETHLIENRHVLTDKEYATDMLASINSAATGRHDGKAASARSYYSRFDIDDDPVSPPESLGVDEGAIISSDEPQTNDSVAEAVTSMLKVARSNGISEAHRQLLAGMLNEYTDVLRVQLLADPPAKIPPLHVTLKDASLPPVRDTQRRYAPPQRSFLEHQIQKLEAVGAVRPNPTSRWASPALAVPKPGPEGFRFTVDLRRANTRTEAFASSMPNLDSMFQYVAGSRFFAKLDLLHAYWQLPLAEDSQEYFTITTPCGLYTPTRLLQGSTDAGNCFQAQTSHLFAAHPHLRSHCLQWLDDFMLHAATENELFSALQAFFEVCREFGLKVHAKKSTLYAKEVPFCGRLFSADGMSFKPRSFDTLTAMKRPELATDLQQFCCAMNWLRSSIPCFAEVAAPLHSLLERCYKAVGGRTRRRLGTSRLGDWWADAHDVAFNALRANLIAQTKLTFPQPDCELCLCTDASTDHWAGVLTQVPRSQRNLPLKDQDHSPLGFVSGSFTGASASWAIVEKEAFAVASSFTRFDYLCGGRHTNLYTDHSNLVFIFDPTGQHPGIARHTANKMTRWAVKLNSFSYHIEMIPGEENVVADMLTRWAAAPQARVAPCPGRLKKLVQAPIQEPTDDGVPDWPSLRRISEAQIKHSSSRPSEGYIDSEGVVRLRPDDAVWVPEHEELQLSILIAAHAAAGGHRGVDATYASMQPYCRWPNMRQDAKEFVNSCVCAYVPARVEQFRDQWRRRCTQCVQTLCSILTISSSPQVRGGI